jgi:hypothetical protein
VLRCPVRPDPPAEAQKKPGPAGRTRRRCSEQPLPPVSLCVQLDPNALGAAVAGADALSDGVAADQDDQDCRNAGDLARLAHRSRSLTVDDQLRASISAMRGHHHQWRPSRTIKIAEPHATAAAPHTATRNVQG